LKFAEYHSLLSFRGYRTGVFWLDYYGVFKITLLSGAVLDTLVLQPVLVLIPMLILVLSFKFQVSKSNFYLDSSLQSKVEEANASDLS
jgi:hypothetical protein